MSNERVILEDLLTETEDWTGYRLFIWGTGNTASLYQEGLSRLVPEGMIIEGYIDNDPSKQGTLFYGKKVFSPNEVGGNNTLILICSPQPKVINSVAKQVETMGLKWRHIDNYIFCKHKDEVLECYDLLEDDKSKHIYYELVKCRIQGLLPSEEIISENAYFSFRDFGEFNANEVFVDCGAFVGDSLERYIWKSDGVFKKCFAFEPDKKNVDAIVHRIERLKREWNLSSEKFELFQCGVGDTSSDLYIERYGINNGLGSKLSYEQTEGTEECRIVTIDDVIPCGFSFLKADIESFEYKMLIGAQKTIKEYSPKLAICIYHNAVDFYSILLLIKKLNPNYKIAVRHHGHSITESVAYAYIE